MIKPIWAGIKIGKIFNTKSMSKSTFFFQIFYSYYIYLQHVDKSDSASAILPAHLIQNHLPS